MLGRWRNLSGEITVIQWAAGVLTFSAQSADLLAGRWGCDAKGDGGWTGPEEAVLDIDNEPGDPLWKLVVRRQGAVLRVHEELVSGERQKPHCGFNGSLSGAYFRVAGSTGVPRSMATAVSSGQSGQRPSRMRQAFTNPLQSQLHRLLDPHQGETAVLIEDTVAVNRGDQRARQSGSASLS